MPSSLIDLVLDNFPANNDTGVSLLSNITITLSGLDYDEDTLLEGFFLEGPDTDQFVGPGIIDQVYPNNISQGDIDDFLESPGFTGIVQGTTTVTGVSGNTLVTFNPTLPLAALTDYTAYLAEVTTSGVVPIHTPDTISGIVTWAFQTGTGSIETVPSSVSSSVLADTFTEQSLSDVQTPLSVVGTTPTDHSIEQAPDDTREIVIEFNKALDPNIADANVSVKALEATDHPGIDITANGELAKGLTVDGNLLRIRI